LGTDDGGNGNYSSGQYDQYGIVGGKNTPKKSSKGTYQVIFMMIADVDHNGERRHKKKVKLNYRLLAMIISHLN
jgi:hypothetical protein